eukprot:scaffold978_cov134-Skeletonema_marinoi.AAC.7
MSLTLETCKNGCVSSCPGASAPSASKRRQDNALNDRKRKVHRGMVIMAHQSSGGRLRLLKLCSLLSETTTIESESSGGLVGAIISYYESELDLPLLINACIELREIFWIFHNVEL